MNQDPRAARKAAYIAPTVEDLMILDVLSSPYPYEQGLVKAILPGGKQITLTSAEEGLDLYQHGYLKIEGMERLNQKLWDYCRHIRNERVWDMPVSCHVFVANENVESFPDHVDPEDVLLYVVEGEKTIILDNASEITMVRFDSMLIEANSIHRAINNKKSVMLSIGFDKFMSEKL